MVVPVTTGRLTSKNVLILDTPQKIQLMRDHFPKWLIDNHCIFNYFKPIDPPPLQLPEQARIHKYRNKQVSDTPENTELLENTELFHSDEEDV